MACSLSHHVSALVPGREESSLCLPDLRLLVTLQTSIMFYGALLPGLRETALGLHSKLEVSLRPAVPSGHLAHPPPPPSRLSATMALSLPPELDTEGAQACHVAL